LQIVDDALLAITISLFDGASARQQFEQAIGQPISSGFPQSLEDIGISLEELSSAASRVSFEKIIDGLRDSNQFAEDALSAIQDYKDALLGLADPAFAVLNAQSRLVQAQKDYNEAVKDGDPQSVIDATAGLA
jgi:hypothetical protein